MDNKQLENQYNDLWVKVKFDIQDSEYCKNIRESDWVPAFGTALCDKCIEKGCKFGTVCIEHHAISIENSEEE